MARWLEYEKRDTFLHNDLHPLTKMVVAGAVVTMAGFFWDFRFILVLLAVGLPLFYISHTPFSWFKPVVAALIVGTYPLVVGAIGQTNPDLFRVLDKAWAGTGILTVTLPVVGRIGFTNGSVMWLMATYLRFFTVTTWLFAFIYTTSVADLASTLLSLRIPQPIVFVVSIAYKFVPYMSRVMDHIMSAQKLRGWSLRSFNPITIAKRSFPLARPLIRRVAVMTDEVTIATQIRGFGSGKVTPTRELNLSNLDRGLIGLTLVASALSMCGVLFFNLGQI